MKRSLTHLVFILDKSGSMSGLEADTIGGFNSMLNKQKELSGECLITTVLFDNQYEILHESVDINKVKPMTAKEYFLGGSTALYDAIGKTINKIIGLQKRAGKENSADKVMFVIITDGAENSSNEFTSDKIKNMIEKEKSKFGWEFIFLGANIDAVKTAGRFGISAKRAQNFHADKVGVKLNFSVMNNAVASFRASNEIPANWNDEIEKDFKTRG